MKKKCFIYPIVFGFSIAMLSAFALQKKDNFEKVEAYSAGSLPTTIYVRDNTESEIRNYYSDLNSLPTSERMGTNLLKNLKPILKDGQVYYSYESGDNIWRMYEITDRDWAKSPASDLNRVGSETYGEGVYNDATKTITNYKYGKSVSDHDYNPYIHALYVNRDVENLTTAWSDHQQTQWGINREHVWPKSQGFNKDGSGGARGDPMHLMAGNGRVNGTEHNNHPYGYVDKTKSVTDPVSANGWTNLSNNYSGISKTLGSGTVFEPQDSDKGDIARAIFYMVARYNYYSGSDSDGIDTNNPNLELVQGAPEKASYTSTTSVKGQMGVLSDLLEWNRLDPPDEWEIHRNNLLYNNFTNNRNPFIDFPEWADYVWGEGNVNYATPSSDALNGSGEVQVINVTSVSVNESATVAVDGTSTLVASIEPSNASNKNVSWTSSNTNVATVSSKGVVTGVAEGQATITVTTEDGDKTDTCVVTVFAAQDLGYVTDVLDRELTGITGNTYSSWSDKTVDSGVIYAGQSAGGNNSIQLRSENSNSGIITTSSTGMLKKVTVSWNGNTANGRTLNIYGKNTAYTSPTQLYNAETQGTLLGTIVKGTSTTLEIDDDYKYIGIRSNSGALYASSITLDWAISVTGVSLDQSSITLDTIDETSATLTATVSPSNAFDKSLSWQSSDLSVVTVNDGVIYVVDSGDAVITVTTTDGGFTDTCNVHVEAPPAVTSVSISLNSLELDLNGSYSETLTATVTGTNNPPEDVEWTSSDPSVATVNAHGVVTGVDVGSATITATSTYDDTKYATCSVTVINSDAESDTLTIKYSDAMSPALPTASGDINANDTLHVDTTASNFAFKEQGIYKANGYLMFCQNKGYLYNTTDLGTIHSITVTYSNNTSTSAKCGIYFGDTVQDTYVTASNIIIAGRSQSDVWTNETVGYGYFLLSTSIKNCQITQIVINYSSCGGGGQVDPQPVSAEYNEPCVNGVAYKMFSTRGGNNNYFTGSMTDNGYYGVTSTTYGQGVNVYFEQNNDGQNLYFFADEVKTYISVTLNGNYIDFSIGTSVPSSVWKYSEDAHCIYYTINETNYTIGNDSGYNTISGNTLSNIAYKIQFKLTAESFSHHLVNKMTCDASGVSAPTFATNYSWSNLYALYNDLDSSEKTTLLNTVGNENGTIIEQAVARYDYLVGKYGTATFNDFMNREPAKIGLNSFINDSKTNTNLVIVILVSSFACLLSFGLFISFKKRKQ